ncbi:unnamed protein product [Rotaria sp. Silwood1]|nr:unnamed protein product [Rotaria sp. Silwood1]
MIVSDALGQTTVPIIHHMSQVNIIYIFYENQAWSEQWTKEWPKIKGIFTDIVPMCEVLQQAAKQCDRNMTSISFVTIDSGSTKQNLNQLDSSFMYTQIMKEILLTIDFNQHHIDKFLTCCRDVFADNLYELQYVNKIEQEYFNHLPIWWYTSPCFLYSMLNRSLRTMEFELIITIGFFIRDLHNHIVELHKEQYAENTHLKPFTVFRGQGLSKADFDRMIKTQGGLLSFNSFLSTSLHREVSLAFAESNQSDPDLIRVLFAITINPTTSNTTFANIQEVSYFKVEEEILFSMHSIFRIGLMKQINENIHLWQVDLTLTSDNDPDLITLNEQMREETYPEKKGWDRLGNILIELEQFNKAQEIYDILLDQTETDSEKASVCRMLGMIKRYQGEYEDAIVYYETSNKIYQEILSRTDSCFTTSYHNIAFVHDNMGNYSYALSPHEKPPGIYQKPLPSNLPDLATSYNNIGLVYHSMDDYLNALSYYQKALEIRQRTLSSNHPDLATFYSNIGTVSDDMGDYSNALSSHQKALEIYQKTIPSNHPHLATCYNNIGYVYSKMGDHSNALLCHRKALEINQHTLSTNHPDLAQSYSNIGTVYNDMGDYSNALSSHQKALEIYQKTIPSNHPHLATCYNNIGYVYNKMGDHSNALLCHRKALEINQHTLSTSHPDLAQSYSNIGTVYDDMGDYSNALSSHQKALEIYQKTLPSNHPHLATCYNNIGYVYNKMGDHSNALLCHQKALEINQQALPYNHSDLAQPYNNIGSTDDEIVDHSNVLSSHQKPLEIEQNTPPLNRSHLATSCRNTDSACEKVCTF